MKWKTVDPSRLQEMIKSLTPIYVLNTSQFKNGRGQIIISFIDGTRKRQFTVPPTFIPLEITSVIPHKEIDNADFKDLLNKRIVTIVDPEQAREYLQTAEAREEFHAITLSNHSYKAQGIDLETGVKSSFSSTPALTSDVEESVSDIQVSTKVRAFMDELHTGAITAKQVLAECKRHASSFTDLDLHYIKEGAKDLEIQKWVETELINKSSDVGRKATSVARSSLSRAVSKKSSRADDDAPENAQEEAELAAGMARARNNQLMNGIPEKELLNKLTR